MSHYSSVLTIIVIKIHHIEGTGNENTLLQWQFSFIILEVLPVVSRLWLSVAWCNTASVNKGLDTWSTIIL